jgi:cytochrome P450
MSKAPVDPDFAFDPTDQTKTQDFEFMAKIRRERPIMRPVENVVLTTRYEDTALAFRDSKTFSAVGDMRAPGVVVPLEESFMGELDAPLHTRIRKVFARVFTRRGALAAEDWTRDRVRKRIAALATRKEADLMKEFAMIVPGSVSAHVMGIPEEHHETLMGWCADVLHSSWPATGRTERGIGLEASFPELSACVDGMIREREQAGDAAPPGLLTVMVQARDEDGRVISAQHARTLVVNMLAGSLSASFMLGNLLYRYLDPSTDFAATIRENPSLIPVAVDESLRYEAPVMFLFRSSRVETTIGGCPVHAGDHIMLGIGAANRDEAVYRDAEEFRLDRAGEPEHLAFGAGPHLCLGNHLTRMAGTVVLEEVLSMFAPGELELAPGFSWKCVDHIMEYGPETLDVVTR